MLSCDSVYLIPLRAYLVQHAHVLLLLPKRGDGYFFFTTNHAGNLYAFPFYGQDEIIIPHHGGGCKREVWLEETSRDAGGAAAYRVGRTFCHQIAAGVAAARSQVDDPVRTAHDIHVVLDDDNGIARVAQP